MYEDIRSSENQLQLNTISHESLMFVHLQLNLIMDRGSVRTDMKVFPQTIATDLVSHRIELQSHFFVQKNSTFVLRRDYLRGDFKTQPPVDRRFRPVLDGCHCLETDRNRTESPVNQRLGSEVVPKQSLVNIAAHEFEDLFFFFIWVLFFANDSCFTR